MSMDSRGPQMYFYLTKFAALMEQCVPVHCEGESSIPDSAVILGIFNGLASSDIAKSHSSNAI